LLQRIPDAVVVDISHAVPKFNVLAGSFVLWLGTKEFEAGSIHVCVVDPGVGTERKRIVVQADGKLFVGPDNGVFSCVIAKSKVKRIYEVVDDKYFRHPVSKTFEGRDVFAPIAAALASGANLDEFARQTSTYVYLTDFDVAYDGPSIEAKVVWVDDFGNAVLSLAWPQNGLKILRITGKNFSVSCSYPSFGFAKSSEPFWYIGSAGHVEIGIKQQSFASIYGVRAGDKITVTLVE